MHVIPMAPRCLRNCCRASVLRTLRWSLVRCKNMTFDILCYLELTWLRPTRLSGVGSIWVFMRLMALIFPGWLLHFTFMLLAIFGIQLRTFTILVSGISPGVFSSNSVIRDISDALDYYWPYKAISSFIACSGLIFDGIIFKTSVLTLCSLKFA